MDGSLDAAARALSAGDPLRALSLAGRHEDALGLTLRGIAYAQLGDLELARGALERAVSIAAPLTRARARAALAEVELTDGDPAVAARAAQAAASELDALGDRRNASMQRLAQARAEVLLGRLGEARRLAAEVGQAAEEPDLRAVAALAQAEIATRALCASEAHEALARARQALTLAPHALLSRALAALERELSTPVARAVCRGRTEPADLGTIERLGRGEVLLVDACRRLAIGGRVTAHLARRPMIFSVLLSLAHAWPAAVPRDALVASAFGATRPNASHRARLRVEVGRLRGILADGLDAAPVATTEGYALASRREVVVLLPPGDDEAARLGLLLLDGAAWTAQRLADHAGLSRRTVQRALAALVEAGTVVRAGRGRAVRYTRPAPRIASRMLLLALLPRG